jgi:hypothetical protein
MEGFPSGAILQSLSLGGIMGFTLGPADTVSLSLLTDPFTSFHSSVHHTHIPKLLIPEFNASLRGTLQTTSRTIRVLLRPAGFSLHGPSRLISLENRFSFMNIALLRSFACCKKRLSRMTLTLKDGTTPVVAAESDDLVLDTH